MQFIKWIFQLVYYYEKDKADGKPYWLDPAYIGLVVSIAAVELAKYAGVTLNPDLQLKIVGVITGIGALVSPHTGIVAKAEGEAGMWEQGSTQPDEFESGAGTKIMEGLVADYPEDFQKAVDDLINNWEGGYVFDPNDAGGMTKYGISQRSYPTLDIKDLSRDEAIAIYFRDFWQKYKLRYGHRRSSNAREGL